MKKKYGLILPVLFLISANCFAQKLTADTLYFCRGYISGKEVGNSDMFGIGPGGDSITVMIKTAGPIKERHVKILCEKFEAGEFVDAGTHKFDVEPNWDYIFFDGINFWSDGYYKVSLLSENGGVLAVNYVTMVLIDKK